MSLPLNKERADILLRALAREHLCLRAEGIRGDNIKDIMRDIVEIAFGVRSHIHIPPHLREKPNGRTAPHREVAGR